MPDWESYDPNTLDFIRGLEFKTLTPFVVLLLIVLAARAMRHFIRQRAGVYRIQHANGRSINILSGALAQTAGHYA